MPEQVKKELLKYKIRNEEELDRAIRKMKLINIACFIVERGE